MKPEKYTIYTITDPRDGKVFYIGLTQDYYGRTRSHLSLGSTCITHKKISEIKLSGLTPIFSIAKLIVATKDDAVDIESAMILDYALKGYPLVNRHIKQRILKANNITSNPLENSYEKGKRPPYHPDAWKRMPIN